MGFGGMEEAMRDHFWLSNEAWTALEPHLPKNQPGARRVDDRRVISGILHILKTGGRWRDVPRRYGPAKTIYNRYARWARRGVWQHLRQGRRGRANPRRTDARQFACESSRFRLRRKRGEWMQALGVSRGGRTTKIHCLADPRGRIVAVALTPGNIADISMAQPMLEALAPKHRLIADKAYDADRLRGWLDERGIEAVIPGRASRNAAYPLNRAAYRRRNIIERMFGKLKNWKRIATQWLK